MLATEFRGPDPVLPQMFGEAVAREVVPLRGYAPDGGTRDMGKRMPQARRRFVGGSFSGGR